MDRKELFAGRVALEIHDWTLVNLGIGLPALPGACSLDSASSFMLVREPTLPATSARAVTLVATDLAVTEPTSDGPVLREHARGVTVEAILAATGAPLLVPDSVPEMGLLPKIASAAVPRLRRGREETRYEQHAETQCG